MRNRLILLALPAAGAGLLIVAAAIAAHIPGATYDGSHQAGGEVEFEVSADGSGITSFTARDIPADTCDFPESSVQFDPPRAIINHSFNYESTIGLSISGNFPQPGEAQGTLRARQMAIPPFIPACDSGNLTWTATADVPVPTATPSPTPSPTPGPLKKGDVDCDGSVGSVDALKELRHVAALSVSQSQPCPIIGSEVNSIFGDMDCNDSVDSVDALRILRFVAALTTGVPAGCDPIGE